MSAGTGRGSRKGPRVEIAHRKLEPRRIASVRAASIKVSATRMPALQRHFADPEAARSFAARVKDYCLDNLKSLLVQFDEKCTSHGVSTHWCKDASEACEEIIAICRSAGIEKGCIVKGKSMATEEIHLNEALESTGFRVVETDLGEYVVQIDHDHPSHIVAPIIHKNRRDIAASFEREGLGAYTEVPETLAMQARNHLRSEFQQAAVGISGVNFAVAETGRIVIVENEGNNRLSTTVPRVHIAVMGIEKLLPREQDLAVFLPLLSESATGQEMPVYVHFISGPKQADDADGPEQVHLILLDNGRCRVLNGPYRSILRCIRCGACLNTCPVYRESSGHAYGHVYPGPLGAVLAPALDGIEAHPDLPKASSLCGACERVCPVKIPIPSMLLQLRHEAVSKKLLSGSISWSGFRAIGTRPSWWRAGLRLLPLAEKLPSSFASGWTDSRNLPKVQGRSFRRWWRERTKP